MNCRLCEFIRSFTLKGRDAFSGSQLETTNEREKHEDGLCSIGMNDKRVGDLDGCENRYLEPRVECREADRLSVKGT
jgi:hypothetical protein